MPRIVLKGSSRGHWRFLHAADLRAIRNQQDGIIPKVGRAKPCTKCGETNYGTWTSSSTGLEHRYCRYCRDERRTEYVKRKLANGGYHTNAQWLQKLSQYDRCPRCKRHWEEIPPRPNKRYKNIWTKDHIKPLLHGGTDDISNIQPLCYQCQFHKNAGA